MGKKVQTGQKFYAVGWFCNHLYDSGINCTPICTVTIINFHVLNFLENFTNLPHINR